MKEREHRRVYYVNGDVVIAKLMPAKMPKLKYDKFNNVSNILIGQG
jgi:hypothetical protein